LCEWAAKTGLPVARVESEVGSGMNGARAKVRRLLADPKVTTVVVEHRDRLGRMNIELVEAALESAGRRLVVLDEGEVDDDLVRDMTEVLTSFCARLYGRRSARNRAEKALRKAAECRRHDVEVTHLRSIALPFVVVHPAAARVRTRLRVEAADEDVLRVVGRHLGSLAGEDLAQRCESTSSRQAAGAVPPRAQAGDHRRELVALGRSDHSHERGLLAARLAQPCRRATDTRLPYPPDRAEAHGPRRRAPRL